MMICCWNDKLFGHYPSSILDKRNTHTTFWRLESVHDLTNSVVRRGTSSIYWAQQSRCPFFTWWRRQTPVSETSCVFIKDRWWIMSKKFVISVFVSFGDINIQFQTSCTLQFPVFSVLPNFKKTNISHLLTLDFKNVPWVPFYSGHHVYFKTHLYRFHSPRQSKLSNFVW
jgi:hypothetical protein